ncbi:MAG: FecR family protein [Segetibacter sp.]|nr:FecR family protein [Segetibacter sp.]
MTKEQIQDLAEKIVLGTATEEEIQQYNRICDFAETTGSDAIKISAEEKEELEGALKRAIFNKAGIGKVYRMNWLKWVSVAASVLVLIGLSSTLFLNNNPETPLVRNAGKKTDSLTFVAHREVNTTGKEKRIQLPDGSLIVLGNKSEITYRQPFVDSRDVTLIGKAYFKVAKDKIRPFTVISGDISTTAIGTEFTVTEFRNAKQIVVRLYEGEVVVKAVDERNKKLKKDVYLLPGQAFVYAGKTKANVKNFKLKNTLAPEVVMNEEVELDHPSLPQNTRGSWFMFNNQPLRVVFDELQNMYDVEIIYSKKDISNMYFIGKFVRGDSLERILKQVATLNNLNVIKKNNKYIITR